MSNILREVFFSKGIEVTTMKNEVDEILGFLIAAQAQWELNFSQLKININVNCIVQEQFLCNFWVNKIVLWTSVLLNTNHCASFPLHGGVIFLGVSLQLICNA